MFPKVDLLSVNGGPPIELEKCVPLIGVTPTGARCTDPRTRLRARASGVVAL
jgi:hypothetical protein